MRILLKNFKKEKYIYFQNVLKKCLDIKAFIVFFGITSQMILNVVKGLILVILTTFFGLMTPVLAASEDSDLVVEVMKQQVNSNNPYISLIITLCVFSVPMFKIMWGYRNERLAEAAAKVNTAKVEAEAAEDAIAKIQAEIDNIPEIVAIDKIQTAKESVAEATSLAVKAAKAVNQEQWDCAVKALPPKVVKASEEIRTAIELLDGTAGAEEKGLLWKWLYLEPFLPPRLVPGAETLYKDINTRSELFQSWAVTDLAEEAAQLTRRSSGGAMPLGEIVLDPISKDLLHAEASEELTTIFIQKLSELSTETKATAAIEAAKVAGARATADLQAAKIAVERVRDSGGEGGQVLTAKISELHAAKVVELIKSEELANAAANAAEVSTTWNIYVLVSAGAFVGAMAFSVVKILFGTAGTESASNWQSGLQTPVSPTVDVAANCIDLFNVGSFSLVLLVGFVVLGSYGYLVCRRGAGARVVAVKVKTVKIVAAGFV